jgi:excinuclease UvrABC nuclease subunit
MQPEGLFTHEMDYPPPLADNKGADLAGAGGQGGGHAAGEAAAKPETPAQAAQDAVAQFLPGGGGVYLLTDDQDRLILLSAAADLRRALRTRLFEPVAETEPVSAVARRRARLGEIVRRIRWRAAYSTFETDFAYLQIAREILPDNYRKHLAFGPAWFVHVNPDSPIPRFLVARVLGTEGVNLGPFPTQPDAHRFVEMIEDAFDLCRCYDSLGQAPRGTTCAYYEMGKCPGPCIGAIPMEQYREMIRTALTFASGDREPALTAWRQQMQALAGERAFERAAAVKQRIERTGIVEQPAFRLVRPIEQFNYLVVQRGRGRTSVRPFSVRGGWITPGEQVPLKEVDQAFPAWLALVQTDTAQVTGKLPDDLEHRSEQIWLLSHYLFKRDPPGLFIPASELDNPGAIAERIRERFGKSSSQTENETQ